MNFRGQVAWKISPENLNLVEEYLSERRLVNTSQTYFDSMRSWDRYTNRVPLNIATREDVRAWYNAVKEKYAFATIDLNGQNLKRLFAFKHDDELAKKTFTPIPFKDIRRNSKKSNALKDKILSREELNLIIKEARHPRSQAFYSVLYESGCRKSEILNLKIRDIAFGETYTTIRTYAGKTGERTLALVDSVPYLRGWLQIHPDRTPEQYVFVTNEMGNLKQMSETTTITTLRNICKRAGIKMRNPHSLRHTRLTELAESGKVSEYDLKQIAGWTPSSNMASIYLHFSGKTNINAMLRARGVEVEEEHKPEQRKLSSGICPKCNAVVADSMIHCPACGYVLDANLRVDTKKEVEGMLTDIIQKLLAGKLDDIQAMRQTEEEKDRADFLETLKKKLKDR